MPLAVFHKPYYVSPISKGQKAYALLRDVLRRTGRVGLGRVVVSTKQHLALVAPQDKGLVVAFLRCGHGPDRARTENGRAAVLDMAEPRSPERFRDEFTEGGTARARRG